MTIVSEEFKEAARLHEKAHHNEASALANARRDGRQKEKTEIAKNLIAEGDPVEKIIRTTGLTREELERIRQNIDK